MRARSDEIVVAKIASRLLLRRDDGAKTLAPVVDEPHDRPVAVDIVDDFDITSLLATSGVVVLSWPHDAAKADRLAELGTPLLLLVDRDAAPPDSERCLQDWLWAPVDDAELRSRLLCLTRRAATHPRRPFIDESGLLMHRGRSLFLSPLDQRIAELLLAEPGVVVPDQRLIDEVWNGEASLQTLRVHLSKMRGRIAPLGLTIRCIRHRGYVMADKTVVCEHD